MNMFMETLLSMLIQMGLTGRSVSHDGLQWFGYHEWMKTNSHVVGMGTAGGKVIVSTGGPYKYSYDRDNPRGGVWRPINPDSPYQGGISWDPKTNRHREPHWDCKLGPNDPGKTKRYNTRGRPIGGAFIPGAMIPSLSSVDSYCKVNPFDCADMFLD